MRSWMGGALMGILLVVGTGSTAASEAKPQPLQGVVVLTARDGIEPGQAMDLVVRVRLHELFHVNSHTPAQEYLIPTTLEMDPSPDLQFGAWIFPKGQEQEFPFSEEPLLVYEGEFLIWGKVEISNAAQPGVRQIGGHLRYQACTAKKCYAPRREAFSFEIRVVAPGTPTRPLHPKVFDSGAP